jgi:hypothetical protein
VPLHFSEAYFMVWRRLMGMCLISAATIWRIVKSEWTTFRSGHVRLNSQVGLVGAACWLIS